ncbi:hypothetical protein [Aquincola sp. J276]|uniref:hypothetical protein n=1 Tax=Aquincola sp. J276 TaxID=2898432 RepID=UPI002151C9B3|nr:hypothetical protein [Aquincola sp. J276]MCR5865231.1 hypothetical protein [Aquincola sp. J276]
MKSTRTAAPAATPPSEGLQCLALEALAIIEAQLSMLGREFIARPDGEAFDLVLMRTLRDIKALNSVVISVLAEDHLRDVAEMQMVVFGEVCHG